MGIIVDSLSIQIGSLQMQPSSRKIQCGSLRTWVDSLIISTGRVRLQTCFVDKLSKILDRVSWDLDGFFERKLDGVCENLDWLCENSSGPCSNSGRLFENYDGFSETQAASRSNLRWTL